MDSRMQHSRFRLPFPSAASFACLLLLLMALAVPAAAQRGAQRATLDASSLFTPAADRAVDADLANVSPSTSALAPAPDAFQRLRASSAMLLRGFPLPDGGTVDLELASFPVFTERTIFVAVTAQGELRLPPPDITFYRGGIPGEPGSFAYLAVERAAVSGTITRQNGASWSLTTATLPSVQGAAAVVNIALVTSQMQAFTCGVTEEDEWEAVLRRGPVSAPRSGDRDTLFAGIALDADFASFQHYGGTDPTRNYIIARLGESSAIYERDLTIRLEASYLRVWGVQDPYTGNSDQLLLRSFGEYWKANMDTVDRALATMISRRPISANGVSQGLAWVDQLCDRTHGYSFVKLSSNNGFTAGHTMVLAHELGHNFGSMHTHSCTWAPPIDSCYTAEPIRNQPACFSRSDIHLILGGGELMSYCHLAFGNSNAHQVWRDRTGPLVRSRAEKALCMGVASTVYALVMQTPVGGESICAGDTIPVTWTGSGINSVEISLSRNSGQSYDTVLAAGIPRSAQSWDWIVPGGFRPSSTLRIRVRDERNDTLVSSMAGDFEIKQGVVITSQIFWRNACVGQGANFKVTANGAGTLRYRWRKNGVDLPGLDSADIWLQNLQRSDDSSLITCVVSGDCGSAESAPALLHVFADPIIRNQPVNDTVCLGGRAVLHVDVDGAELTYKWITLGKVYDVNSPDFVIDAVTSAEANKGFYCEVRSPCGNPINSRSAFIIVPDVSHDRFIAPAPSSVLEAGADYNVVWRMFCVATEKLEVTLDGTTWTTLRDDLTADDVSLLWKVPAQETTKGQFRISDAAQPSRFKLSPQFIIRKKPFAVFSAGEVSFGRLPTGSPSTQSVTVTNTGLADLNVTRTAVVGNPEASVPNGAPFTVAPSGSRDITVEVTPTAAGPLEGFLLVEHNAAGSPDSLPITGEVYVVTSAPAAPAPLTAALGQNYPNPVSLSAGGRTRVSFELPRAATVKIALYNLLGREVRVLASGAREAGRHMIAADLSGLPAGTYLYRAQLGATTITRALHLLR
jgi:hypothetical protein